MIQTSGDFFSSECVRANSQGEMIAEPKSQNNVNGGNESEMRRLSPIANLSEEDISSLLDTLNQTNTVSSTAMPIQATEAVNVASSPQCAGRSHCLTCSYGRAVPWCPAHLCALRPDLPAAGCRSTPLHSPGRCAGGCLCSGLIRYPLCSAQSPHGSVV